MLSLTLQAQTVKIDGSSLAKGFCSLEKGFGSCLAQGPSEIHWSRIRCEKVELLSFNSMCQIIHKISV